MPFCSVRIRAAFDSLSLKGVQPSREAEETAITERGFPKQSENDLEASGYNRAESSFYHSLTLKELFNNSTKSQMIIRVTTD